MKNKKEHISYNEISNLIMKKNNRLVDFGKEIDNLLDHLNLMLVEQNESNSEIIKDAQNQIYDMRKKIKEELN